MTKDQALEKLHANGLNWSAVSSFTYMGKEESKERWYNSYILGIRETSKEMEFGSYIDKKIQNNPSFMPDLPRYELMQHKMKVMFNGLLLFGTPDGINVSTKHLKELWDYKTGKAKWTETRAQEHGQLLFYLLLLWITEKIKPEDFECGIHWLPTRDTSDFKIELISETKFQSFKVKHTNLEVLKFGAYIKDVHFEMEQYIENRAINND